ncbi:MAG: ThuA domain-containing protein [Halioglobus sp.]
MSIINYSAPHKLLTVARGHPYERDAFASLFTELTDYEVCHVEQPLAQQLLTPAAIDQFDAVLFYDMPGVDFTTGEASPGLIAPSEEFVANFTAMLEAGIGIVFMHHAIASWPAWPEFAEIIGGRFHYRPASLRGKDWPDSGYRHQVQHTVSVAAEHPVTAGLPATYEMTDELYLCPIFEEDVTPLLRSDYAFERDNFYSSAAAVAGTMNSNEGWAHPTGSNLVGWVKKWGNSPIVYLQGGDDAVAMQNPVFGQLVQNAVRWVASEQAHAWARGKTD